MNQVNQIQEKTPLIKLLSIIVGNWRKLLIFNAIIGFITVVYLFFFASLVYKSSVTIVVLEDDSMGNSLMSAMSDMLPMGFAIGGGADIDRYVAYVNSRRVYESVIDKFDLMNEWDLEIRDDAYRILSQSLLCTNNDNGTITISMVFDNDPNKAADIVNHVYDELYTISVAIAQDQARRYREYSANNYMFWNDKLVGAEDSLKLFQQEKRIYDLEEQVKLALNSLSELESNIIASKIELDFKRATLSPGSPDIQSLEKYIELVSARVDTVYQSEANGNIPLEQLPEQALSYLRILRDVTVGQKITEFLAMQLEQAKLDEQKSSASLYLLDEGIPAGRKFKPKRLSVLIVTMFFSTLLSLLYIRTKEWYYLNKSTLIQMLK